MRISSSSACTGRKPAATVARVLAPANLRPGAILTDVGSVKGSVVADVGAASSGTTSISFPDIRSPARSTPGQRPGLPNCSMNRWCILTPRDWRRRIGKSVARLDGVLAGDSVPTSTSCLRSIMIMVLAIVESPAAPDRLQHCQHGPSIWNSVADARRSSSTRPAASVTSRELRHLIRRCGGTCS